MARRCDAGRGNRGALGSEAAGLNIKGREDCLYWLNALAEDDSIDTALVFGTLESLPSGLLERIGTVWIENGAAGQLREGAGWSRNQPSCGTPSPSRS